MNESLRNVAGGLASVLLLNLTAAQAATITKTNNVDDLSLPSSWVGGVAPGPEDVALWDATVAGASASPLASDAVWGGIRIANPGGAVNVGAGGTLSLGASGIDMGAATADLAIGADVALLAGRRQLWNVAAGRAVAVSGALLRQAGALWLVQGLGSVSAPALANDATGMVGPWAHLGSAATTRYIALSAGTVSNFSGVPVLTADGVVDTGGVTNYEAAAGGTVAAGARFHTLRYTGGAGTVGGAFEADGLMHCGSGALTVGGPVTIGWTRELVVLLPAGQQVTLNAVSNNAGGASALVKGGSGQLRLQGDCAFTGPLTVGEGTLQLVPALNGATLPGDIYLNSSGYLQVNSGNSLTLAGAVAGPGQIHKWNGGMLTLAASNSFAGVAQIFAGSIRLADSAALGSAAGATQLRRFDDGNRGRVELNGFSTTEPFSFEDGGNAGAFVGWGGFLENNNTLTNSTLTGALTLAKHGTLRGSGKIILKGPVSGAANVVKDGTGTLEIETNLVFTGGLVISNGLVHVTSNGRLGSGNFAGNILITNTASFFYNATTNQTLSGVIAGNGAIEKWRSEGVLTLAGTNTFTGSIKVLAGTLRLGSDGALGSAAGATQVRRHDDSNRGVLDLGGRSVPEPLVFDDSGYAGATLGYGGFLENSDPRADAAVNGAVTLNRHATVRGAGNVSLTGAVSGPGRLVKQGTNTLTLAAANSYTGATVVVAGTLRLGASGALPAVSDVILSGGTLDAGSGVHAGASLTVSGDSALAFGSGAQLVFGDSVAKAWSGSLTLTGALGPHSLRFPAGLTHAQVMSMSYNGGRVYLTWSGYVVTDPPGTVLFLQ